MFEVSDDLIPDTGRLLQCSSCDHRWHFIPISEIKVKNEFNDINQKSEKNLKKNIFVQNKKIEKKVNFSIKNQANSDQLINKKNIKKSIGFLSLIFITIITFIALVILVDTFKYSLSSFIPNLDHYLKSLFETLKDIFLFISDLFN